MSTLPTPPVTRRSSAANKSTALARASTLPSRPSPAQDSGNDSENDSGSNSSENSGDESDHRSDSEVEDTSKGRPPARDADHAQVCWKAIDALLKLE